MNCHQYIQFTWALYTLYNVKFWVSACPYGMGATEPFGPGRWGPKFTPIYLKHD
jgi:hypothetical protein